MRMTKIAPLALLPLALLAGCDVPPGEIQEPTTGGVVIGEGPTDDPPEGAPQTIALAPSCVQVERVGEHRVNLYNRCGYNVRVKVIIAWGPDSSCIPINAGGQTWVKWTFGGFDRLDNC
jgi:hypothetical protein